MATLSQTLSVASLLLFSAEGRANDFTLRSGNVAPGSGVSQNGSFKLTGVCGEPANEASIGGAFTLHAGFLAAMSANQAPIAGPDVVSRSANGDLKISLTQLLANDFDPDTGPLTLQIAAQSVNGVNLTVIGNWVYYLHASTNADAFTYAITDTRGAVTQGRVDILINDPNGQFSTQLHITLGAAGARLRFTAIRTRTYVVQYRDNFDSPWQDLADAINLGFGEFGLDDPAGGSSRFYRAVYRE